MGRSKIILLSIFIFSASMCNTSQSNSNKANSNYYVDRAGFSIFCLGGAFLAIASNDILKIDFLHVWGLFLKKDKSNDEWNEINFNNLKSKQVILSKFVPGLFFITLGTIIQKLAKKHE